MSLENLEIKILNEKVLLPLYGTPGSAGLDLVAAIEEPLILRPNEVKKIPTGIAINIQDPGFAALALPRSGLGSRGIILGNAVGLIDSDYTGQLMLAVWNRTEEDFEIGAYEKIAQLVIMPVVQPKLKLVKEFTVNPNNQRGDKGFGSTGQKQKM